MGESNVSRRQLLHATVASATGWTVCGTAVAQQDRYIIGTATPAALEAAQERADSVYRVLDFGAIGQAVAGVFTEQALEALRQRDDVRYIEPDGTWHALQQTLPWGIDRIDAEVAHDNGETGSGADIAIIDTGIDDDHPDLQANVGAGEAFVRCRGRNCNYEWSDDNDHGTHCAGIADAVDNTEGVVGVSTEATLHAVKVLDNTGSGSWSDVAAGIEYTADQGWDVGSLSLGGSSSSQTVKDACTYAYNNGVLLVAAAGNDGPCSNCVGYPAAYEECIAVSATSEDDSLAGFSSTGPEVELAAPGENIHSTVIGGYSTFDGTSMSCPHVSGTGGQLMANGYSNTEARNQLKSTAEDIGLASNEQGSGLVDTAAALGLDSSDNLGGDNTAPSCTIVNPNDGDTVSGTVTIQVDASDNEDDDSTLEVEVSIDGGEWLNMTYNSDSGYYEYDWDTTAVDDGDHTLQARATDSDGARTESSQITVTVDNTADDTVPTVDSLSLAEVETDNEDAEFDASWQVSDDDGDLDSVDLTLTDLDDGDTEDSASVDVSGDTASGTTRLVAAGDDGAGHTYEVEAVVTDANGNTASDTATETESDDQPDASIDAVSEVNSQNPHAEFDIQWSASDDNGDLDTAELTLYDETDGGTEDSETVDISGGSAGDTTRLRAMHDDGSGHEYTAELVVTDANGNSDTTTTTFPEDGTAAGAADDTTTTTTEEPTTTTTEEPTTTTTTEEADASSEDTTTTTTEQAAVWGGAGLGGVGGLVASLHSWFDTSDE